jgi:hypothetical protein
MMTPQALYPEFDDPARQDLAQEYLMTLASGDNEGQSNDKILRR